MGSVVAASKTYGALGLTAALEDGHKGIRSVTFTPEKLKHRFWINARSRYQQNIERVFFNWKWLQPCYCHVNFPRVRTFLN
ncbi:MAG: hypothetical protein R3C11_28195 [Planctomycetaceae bacterium]